MDRINLKVFIAFLLSILWTVNPFSAQQALAGTDLVPGAAAATAVACNLQFLKVYKGEYVSFDELPKPLQDLVIAEDQEHYSFYLLGSNGGTANPYLVRDETGKPIFVYKAYIDKHRDGITSPPEMIKVFDESAFAEMQKSIDKGIDIGFKIPRIFNSGSPVISKLEYIPGFNFTIVDLNESDKTRKKILHTVYNIRVEKFIKNFMVKFPNAEIKRDKELNGLRRYEAIVRSSSSGVFRVHIRPDNVIVDLNTYRMTLIDPN